MELRSRYCVTALGLRRKGANLEGDQTSEPIKAGDILLVAGAWKQIQQLKSKPRNLILLTLPADIKPAVPMSSHAPIAFAVLLAMVALLVLEALPMLVTILLTALVLVATGCLTMDRAYPSIQWSTLVLVAGLLPLALALALCACQLLGTPAEDNWPHVTALALYPTKALAQDQLGAFSRVGGDDVVALGQKILSLERDFNKRAGFTAQHDRLPRYFQREALPPHNVVFDVADEQLDELFNW